MTNKQLPHIFCDFDGVLVDFERGFEMQYGKKHNEVPEFVMWKIIKNNMKHWEQLPAMPGALMLWAYIAPYQPTILTGCPTSGREQAEAGKTFWKDRELGQHVPIITCFSRHKPKHMINPGDILIDDMEKNIIRWQEAGGIGILHVNAADTIEQLKAILNGSSDSSDVSGIDGSSGVIDLSVAVSGKEGQPESLPQE